MNRNGIGAGLAALLLPLTAAAEPADGKAFLALLARVPAAPEILDDVEIASFVDYRALEAAGGIAPPESWAALDQEGQRTWVSNSMRIMAGPSDLAGYMLPVLEDMPRLVGIDFLRIDSALGFGEPPQQATLLASAALGPHRPAIGVALAARGFAARMVEGVAVWHRGEDGHTNLREREPGDPFGGPLGKSARIALLPDVIAGSAFWAVTESMVAAAADQRPSLADTDGVAAAVAAVTDPAFPAGGLIQARLVNGPALGFAPADPTVLLGPNPTMTLPEPPPGVLPLYSFALFADRATAEGDEGVIALVFGTAEAAASGAETVAMRLSTMPTRRGPEESMTEIVDVSVATNVYEAGNGLAVGVIRLREAPLAAEGPLMANTRGRAFRFLTQALYNRDLAQLQITE